jgi:intracellular multiplication protein IcmJ
VASQKRVSLLLSAKRKDFRDPDRPGEEIKEKEFEAVKRKVHERDNNTCCACGFQMKTGGFYRQVHHLNDDHGDNRPDNLVVLCMHCHASFHVGFWGSRDEATLVYLPEIEQWQLSHLCRLLLVTRRFLASAEGMAVQAGAGNNIGRSYQGRTGQGAPTDALGRAKAARQVNDTVESLFSKIRAREVDAKEILKTCDPAELGNALTQLPDEEYNARQRILGPFRLLLLGEHKDEASKDYLSPIVDGWLDRGGPFSGMDPLQWIKVVGTGATSARVR